ncbi:hypothetical protein MSP8887_04252 [Marinomonas spartinae]|uniref:Uncharacterized protein n=1 Tax=Marinomonas spartinae TaxID=1792290 RepID=A0A1A8T5S3_9GAMM|nr:hypothetical protein MSP8886_00650 [Marinomonas spartinae]SBS40216.1 hypothetical protein MSP8887_04252 [Marinomonas spartinae]
MNKTCFLIRWVRWVDAFDFSHIEEELNVFAAPIQHRRIII